MMIETAPQYFLHKTFEEVNRAIRAHVQIERRKLDDLTPAVLGAFLAHLAMIDGHGRERLRCLPERCAIDARANMTCAMK